MDVKKGNKQSSQSKTVRKNERNGKMQKSEMDKYRLLCVYKLKKRAHRSTYEALYERCSVRGEVI